MQIFRVQSHCAQCYGKDIGYYKEPQTLISVSRCPSCSSKTYSTRNLPWQQVMQLQKNRVIKEMDEDNNNRLLHCKSGICRHGPHIHTFCCGFIQVPGKVQQAPNDDSATALWTREFTSLNKSQLRTHPVFHFLMQLLTLTCCFANCTLLHHFDLLSDLSQIMQLHRLPNSPLQGRD